VHHQLFDRSWESIDVPRSGAGGATGEHLEEHHADSMSVRGLGQHSRPLGEPRTVGFLRQRHLVRPGAPARRLESGDLEADDPDGVYTLNKHMLRPERTVDQPEIMSRVESFCDLEGEIHRTLDRQRLVLFD
jgi:hypothetical protein